MPHIPVLPPERASNQSNTVYDEFYRRMSFSAPPNFITTQGHSATAARGTWELVRNVLLNGEIARWKKEMIFVAISHDRHCNYCEAAHIACCRMLGVDPGMIERMVRDVTTIPDLALRDMVRFSLKCARDPQSLETADYESLAGHGLTQSQIVELIAMSGLAVYANIMADATAMEPDKMFTSL
jgi:uncharacterized peroxidase-related enzyme